MAILDSGSEISLLPWSIIEQYELQDELIFTYNKLETFGGASFPSNYVIQVMVTFENANEPIEVTFAVDERKNAKRKEIIIGNDVCRGNDLDIDCGSTSADYFSLHTSDRTKRPYIDTNLYMKKGDCEMNTKCTQEPDTRFSVGYVNMMLNGEKFEVMIDTGSVQSTIEKKIIKKLQLENRIKESETKRIRGLVEAVEVEGKIRLSVELIDPENNRRVEFEHEFQVVSGSGEDIAVGLPFMFENRLMVKNAIGKLTSGTDSRVRIPMKYPRDRHVTGSRIDKLPRDVSMKAYHTLVEEGKNNIKKQLIEWVDDNSNRSNKKIKDLKEKYVIAKQEYEKYKVILEAYEETLGKDKTTGNRKEVERQTHNEEAEKEMEKVENEHANESKVQILEEKRTEVKAAENKTAIEHNYNAGKHEKVKTQQKGKVSKEFNNKQKQKAAQRQFDIEKELERVKHIEDVRSGKFLKQKEETKEKEPRFDKWQAKLVKATEMEVEERIGKNIRMTIGEFILENKYTKGRELRIYSGSNFEMRSKETMLVKARVPKMLQNLIGELVTVEPTEPEGTVEQENVILTPIVYRLQAEIEMKLVNVGNRSEKISLDKPMGKIKIIEDFDVKEMQEKFLEIVNNEKYDNILKEEVRQEIRKQEQELERQNEIIRKDIEQRKQGVNTDEFIRHTICGHCRGITRDDENQETKLSDEEFIRKVKHNIRIQFGVEDIEEKMENENCDRKVKQNMIIMQEENKNEWKKVGRQEQEKYRTEEDKIRRIEELKKKNEWIKEIKMDETQLDTKQRLRIYEKQQK